MKLQFKSQQFQNDAALAVVNVFAGQTKNSTQRHEVEAGVNQELFDGTANAPVSIDDDTILKNLRGVQSNNNIKISDKLFKTDRSYNLTIEMETGVGKTYTYIKTIHELFKSYGWCKFIVVVPSIAIREGVNKTFEITQEHFAAEYNKKIRFTIYNSANLSAIENFASDSEINVMIINSQAFNARGESVRRIHMPLDEFNSRPPIDVIAATNPILIIDEPQSVEGPATRERLPEFKPLITLRYSATHRFDSVYNMVYRLDAVDAYNRRLVKKIQVTGIKSNTNASSGFVYLERLNLSTDAYPTATIHFDCKSAGGIRQVVRTVKEGANLYQLSGGLDEYSDSFVIKSIDGRDNSVEFINGIKIFIDDAIGSNNDEQIRRLQIRETITAHLERESKLFNSGIKVLSLFFIDKVANYKIYDDDGNPQNGNFAKFFEEEYSAAVNALDISNDAYKKYLEKIPVNKTHAGYFSIDKKGRLVDSKLNNRSEQTSDDVDAYELIMRNKELLLDTDAEKSPVRFIFSHSALREGWDNPNVFQICTLKQSSSDIRKRQEVGRGLRLCVNNKGNRVEDSDVNILTVIASESYSDFTRKLQSEIADAVNDRPRNVTKELFIGKTLSDGRVIDDRLAEKIYSSMMRNGYLDDEDVLTAKYHNDKHNGDLEFCDEVNDCKDDIIKILDTIYQPIKIENAHGNNVTAKVKRDKLKSTEFLSLWNNLKAKTGYRVKFDSKTLIDAAVTAINANLIVPELYLQISRGILNSIDNIENLRAGTAFSTTSTANINVDNIAPVTLPYDFAGKLVDATGLTRKNIIAILCKLNHLDKINNNPEEFIIKAAKIINTQKIKIAVDSIIYTPTGNSYDIKIFYDEREGRLDENALKTNDKSLYNFVIYDSDVEKNFATALDNDSSVELYIKLPRSYFVATPAGKYNPDWAVVFRNGDIQFIAETKGSSDELQLREIEKIKTQCAKEHFAAISDNLHYAVVKNFDELRDRVGALKEA